MKKKGAELISIFLISMLVFCSFSVSAYADTNEWGYNDSVVNSRSVENKQLYFIPLAPYSDKDDYTILDYNNVIYLILSQGPIDWYGQSCIYSPSINELEFYQLDNRSNNWTSCDVDSLPRWNLDTGKVAFWGCTFIDCTYNKHSWGLAAPYQESAILNQKTGYRLYWNLSLIYIKILNWVNNIANNILSVVLLRFLCITGLAGEFIIFSVILIRRVGELSEKNNL